MYAGTRPVTLQKIKIYTYNTPFESSVICRLNFDLQVEVEVLAKRGAGYARS